MNPLESAFYTGIGLALKGKEKVEEAARKFADEHKMTVDEGKKFVDDVVASAENTKEDLTKKIEETTENLISKMGLVKQKEVDTLKAKVAELENELKKVKGN